MMIMNVVEDSDCLFEMKFGDATNNKILKF